MINQTKKKDVMTLKSGLSALKTLTAMQLKEKMDLGYLRSFKQTLFKAIFFILEFAGVTAICYLLFWACQLLRVFDVANGRIPAELLTTVLAAMLLLSTVFTTGGLVNSLYLSRDNLVLLTFPATPTMVFVSKLLVYYVHELKKNFMFLIPFFCGYGIALGYPVYYYFWVILLFAFVAAIPVLLGALLSMPALFAYQFIKKSKIAQAALGLILYAGLIALTAFIISVIPEEINFMQTGLPREEILALTQGVANGFPPIYWLTKLLIGTPYSPILVNGIHTFKPVLFNAWSAPMAFGLIFALSVLTALGLLLARPLFYKMASKPFEFAKKTKIEEKKNEKTPVLLSAVKKEWLVALRDGTVTSLTTQLIVIMPLAIALLNAFYSAMNRNSTGIQMTVAFNFVIMLLILLSTNIRMASAYSKDGFSAYLNKVQPSTYGSLLFAKLTVNLVMGFIGVLITTIVYSFFYTAGSVNLCLFGLTAYAVYVAHAFWSAEMDIMNPQYDQYATFSAQTNNPNENKSSLLCFLLAFAFALVIFLLVQEGITLIWLKALAVAIGLVAFKAFTFFLKIKVYYKEK
jgi:hypothetical protein